MSEHRRAGSQGAYRLIERCVEDVVGADIAEHLAGRITRCVDQSVDSLELASPREYLSALQTGDERAEALLEELLAAVLVHETFFYRFASQLEALEREFLMPLALSRMGGVVKLWSAGCSSGPEAYTLAMLCARSKQSTENALIFEVLGTDLCSAFLQEARDAIYSTARIKELPTELRDRFLRHKGNDSYVVSEELCRMVRFRRHNLLHAPPGHGFDVICCRNVLMYLRPAARRTALEHLSRALAPQGVLLVGHSESLRDVDDLFVPHDRLALGIYGRAIEGARALTSSALPEPPQYRQAPDHGTLGDQTEAGTETGCRSSPTVADSPSHHRLSLEGEYDRERDPEQLARLKSQLAHIIDLELDVIVEADDATCLDRATATLIARAARAIASRGKRLSIVASRPSVRRWAERYRLPLDDHDCGEDRT